MANHPHGTARLTQMLLTVLLLAACGQKGGLVRPEAANSAAGTNLAIAIAETEAPIVLAKFEPVAVISF